MPFSIDASLSPILCLLSYSTHRLLLLFFSREKPLAMYVFSNNRDVVRELKESTSSGGFLLNDTVVHAGSK
jgi:aldehyde dehydrogenase (NAD+)